MGVAVKIVDGIINRDGEVKTGKVECRAMEALNREAFTLTYKDMAITIPLTEVQKLVEKARRSK